MSAFRQSLLRVTVPRQARPAAAPRAWRRAFASHRPQAPPSKSEGFGGLAVATGAVAVIVPTSLWFLTRGHPEGIKHNDHDAQKGLHTAHTTVEESKYPAGRVGGKLHGIDDVVTTRHEDVDSDLPHDALNHPVNREKIEKTMQLKPPTKRVDPIKSVRD